MLPNVGDMCSQYVQCYRLLLVDIFSTVFSFGGRLVSLRSSLLNPMSSPITPPGLGTGHSLFPLGAVLVIADVSATLALLLLPLTSLTPSNWAIPSFTSVVCCDDRRRAHRGLPSGEAASAYATRGAGQGRMCGRPTTRKLATTVVAKSEEVMRERGCRWGGIV